MHAIERCAGAGIRAVPSAAQGHRSFLFPLVALFPVWYFVCVLLAAEMEVRSLTGYGAEKAIEH